MRYKKMIGEEVYLTALTVDDAGAITKWYNNAEITQFLDIHREVKSLETVKKDVETFIETSAAFAIFSRQADVLIGYAVLGGDHIEILIGETDYRLKGFYREAISFLLDYGFNIKNCRIIYLSAYSHDQAALALYEEMGFEKSVVKRERLVRGRNTYDQVYFSMLAPEYFQREKRNAQL